jgi:cytochrome c peroxidase
MKKLFAVLIISIAVLCMSHMQPVETPTLYPFQNFIPFFAARQLGLPPQPPDNVATVAGVYLGKRLFYEKRLSRDHTMSCGTCHSPGHAFADFRQFSIGLKGQVGLRNAPPLFNLAWHENMFWDGRSPGIEHQITDPIINPIEMDNNWDTVIQRLKLDSQYASLFVAAFGDDTIDSMTISKAIAQFERSLISFNSKYDRYVFQRIDSFSESEQRGMAIFNGKGKCSTCHSGILLTDNRFRNNGLDKAPAAGRFEATKYKLDYGKFKVPSLRNIALTAPYMHDGRFDRLEDVVNFYSEQIQVRSKNIDSLMRPLGRGIRLSGQEKKDLVAFLRTLTDYEFVSNSAHKE